MPKAEIMSANSGKYTPPHERRHGPWEDWELMDAGRDLERAEKVRGNPKFMEAVAKHHEKKAEEHRKMADGMRSHMKRGLVSESAMKKAAERKNG